ERRAHALRRVHRRGLPAGRAAGAPADPGGAARRSPFRALTAYPLGEDIPPGEALRRLCRGERPFLLDGATPADGLGRFSLGGGDAVARHRDPLIAAPPLPPGPAGPFVRLERALAGWGPLCAVGVLGYDLGRAVERVPPRDRPDDLRVAPVDLAGYDAVY